MAAQEARGESRYRKISRSEGGGDLEDHVSELCSRAPHSKNAPRPIPASRITRSKRPACRISSCSAATWLSGDAITGLSRWTGLYSKPIVLEVLIPPDLQPGGLLRDP